MSGVSSWKEHLLALARNAECDASRPALQRRKFAEAERFKKLAAIYLDTAKRPRMKLELSNEIVASMTKSQTWATRATRSLGSATKASS